MREKEVFKLKCSAGTRTKRNQQTLNKHSWGNKSVQVSNPAETGGYKASCKSSRKSKVKNPNQFPQALLLHFYSEARSVRRSPVMSFSSCEWSTLSRKNIHQPLPPENMICLWTIPDWATQTAMQEKNEKLAYYINRRNLFSYSGESSFIFPAKNHKTIDERLPNFMGLTHNLLKSIKFTVY